MESAHRRTSYHFPKESGKGFTLIEVLVSVALIGAMLMAFQAVLLSTPLAKATKNTGVALTIAQNQLEILRHAGYAALPPTGVFSDPLLADLVGGAGAVTVSTYNASTKEVKATVTWTERNSTRSVSLTTLITESGGLP